MQKKYLPIVFLFAVLLLLLAHMGGRMAAVPVFSRAEEKCVYLTFDDGPSTKVTSRVLDILQKEGVKATFFIVGDRVKGREDVLRRIAKEGHTVGVHSQTHDYKQIYASLDALLADAAACAETVRRVTGVIPRVYRFPGGGEHRKETAALRKAGYRVIAWNAVCGDEEGVKGRAALTREAIRTSEGKACVVLLLHDSASHAETAEALPAIIGHFRAKGYVFRAF